MLLDLTFVGLFQLVGFVIGLFPDDSITWPDATGFGGYVGNLVGPLNVWLPIAEVVACLALTLTVVLPALLTYRLAMWLWTLLPDSFSGSGPS